jgi:hypothetical protein
VSVNTPRTAPASTDAATSTRASISCGCRERAYGTAIVISLITAHHPQPWHARQPGEEVKSVIPPGDIPVPTGRRPYGLDVR